MANDAYLAELRASSSSERATPAAPGGALDDRGNGKLLLGFAIVAYPAEYGNSGIMTFVVGVANPPGDNAGDNLANLNVIAEAGGTESAFIVATGGPT